jgi:membrane protein implicated in regulation of membrane protease activity
MGLGGANMKTVWQHFLEAIIFFIVLGLIYNIVGRINVIIDPETKGTLVIIIAVALLFLWTFVKMRINRKDKEMEEK